MLQITTQLPFYCEHKMESEKNKPDQNIVVIKRGLLTRKS